ncbi:hypothetical protein LPJ57_009909, partial [Coemansia sp. RSA 486]
AAAPATVASPSNAAGASASAPNSAVSTIGNNYSQLSFNSLSNAGTAAASTTPQALDSSAHQPQPRYMTRSVAQSAARRKQEQLMLEQHRLDEEEEHEETRRQLAAAASVSQSHILSTAAAAFPYSNSTVSESQINPYSLLDRRHQQYSSHNASGPWTASALYQAARAVAAAGGADSKQPVPAVAASVLAPRQHKAAAGQQPAAKRRRNAAPASAATATAASAKTAATQKAPRGRATQRTRQQQ